MSNNGIFTVEDADIVRLTPDADCGLARSGWVNVGAFAIAIETSAKGNLTLSIYPCGAENRTDLKCVHRGNAVTASKADAMRSGATDLDA